MAHSLSRRHMLGCCAAAAAGLFTSLTARADEADPPPGDDLLTQTFAGLDPAALWDAHAHLLGTGDAGSGCSVHAHLQQWWHPIESLRKRVIMGAAGVPADAPSVDRAYVARLRALTHDFPAGARWLLYAFDQAHDDQGQARPDWSTFHVPNRYAAAVAAEQPERFAWVGSIHPYRSDAIEQLDRAIAEGALAIKWLPSAMNIDMRDARVRPFYERLAAADLPLIVHGGEEKAVPGVGRDELGNPLLVRAALERGVRVIVAHCASLGHALDLDARHPSPCPAFELFARLMDESAWQGRLLGDVSAVFQANRRPAVWRSVLQREDWHGRLLHGSDYPLPGVGPLYRLDRFVRAGLLPQADVPALEALRRRNPLLFDLALKRRLRADGRGLSSSVFDTRAHLACRVSKVSPSATA
ncbi:amidohydrolase family protein [Aquabacterium sp.]|uniref:amidohydrolase family protein n=1 Tax=Aquabacterium sp. TaxID=1872578 RepID=UPI002B9A2C26|nr:amidohydrolase family protein [Aquabacterium sp.]HSW08097.1 amidohydrolase family protein [Aquabacterium sp.]